MRKIKVLKAFAAPTVGTQTDQKAQPIFTTRISENDYGTRGHPPRTDLTPKRSYTPKRSGAVTSKSIEQIVAENLDGITKLSATRYQCVMDGKFLGTTTTDTEALKLITTYITDKYVVVVPINLPFGQRY